MTTSRSGRPRRTDLARTVAFAIIAPVFFLAVAAFAQPHLGSVLRRSWPLALLAFGAGALSILPGLWKRPLSLITSLIAFITMGAVAAHTSAGFVPIALMLPVLGGFFFGLCAYSVLFQLRRPRTKAQPSGVARARTR